MAGTLNARVVTAQVKQGTEWIEVVPHRANSNWLRQLRKYMASDVWRIIRNSDGVILAQSKEVN